MKKYCVVGMNSIGHRARPYSIITLFFDKLSNVYSFFCCQTMVLEGGLVPKGLYMTEGDLEREGCPLTEDSIYHSVSLGRGQVSLCNVGLNKR